MKILKILVILSSIFLFLNADDHHYKEHKYRNLDYLDLNETQVKELKKVLINYKYKYKEFYESKEDDEKELKAIMKNDSFDKNKYINIYKKIHEKAAILEANKMEEIHKILTPKQRDKFTKYIEEWEVD